MRTGRRTFLAATAGAALGCGAPAAAGAKPVVYCALDRAFAEPILDELGARAIFDVEATKSVALAEKLLRERDRPVCDVYWNNEILNTLRLCDAGLFEPLGADFAPAVPPEFRDPLGRWFGFAARARVLLCHVPSVGDAPPATLAELTDAKWKGKVGIAKPLFGTTASHVACLYAARGAKETEDWLRRLKANDVKVLAGNKRVAEEVGAGLLACGLTDTDDAAIEIAAGRPVKMIFPDAQGEGTIVLPNTVAAIKGAPRKEQALEIVRKILAPEIEARLAKGESRQLPLQKPELADPAYRPTKIAKIDFALAAKNWTQAMAFVKSEFAG
ncbi:MAG TPA: extracellular solute-binding protein [Planctomycetia bacterium]|nr:extracellular solute-binding protein [Planctomycetia bacterium]